MGFKERTVAIWAGMKFAVGVRRILLMSMALLYFISIGINVFWITTLFAVGNLIAVLMEFPTGAVADYDSRKKSLMICYFLFGVAYLGIFFTTNFWLIAIFWILNEIAWTFGTGAGGAWVVDNLGSFKEKKSIVGLISKGFLFQKGGFLIGGLIGFLIIARNFRYIWLIGGLMYFVLFLVMWRFGEERNFKPEKIPAGFIKKSWMKARESYKFILHSKNKNKRILMLGDFYGGIIWGVFWIGMPLMFVEILTLTPESLSGLNSVFALLTLAVPFVIRKNKLDKGFGKYLFWIFLASGLFVILFGLSKNLMMGIIFMGLIQFVLGIAEVIGDSASHYYSDSKIRASLGSIGSINGYIANAIGIFLAGVGFITIGINWTLVIAGILVFFQGFIYLMMKE